MDIGYIRVSSADQKIDRQLVDLNLPPEQLYIDRSSGKDKNRPELQNLLKAIRAGDVLHVHSLDRLARNLIDLLDILDGLVRKGVEIRIHKENLILSSDQESPLNRLMLQMLGAMAEWERAIIRERQAEGIRAAKASGKPMGRPSSVTKEQKEEVYRRLKADMLANVSRISRETGVPRTTCANIKKQLQLEMAQNE